MSHICLIAGSPAAGKSTISRLLAENSPKSVHIPVDDLRTMVIGGVVHPGFEWPPELIEQLALARRTASRMALDYHAAGFRAVIDDFWDPYSLLEEYRPVFAQPDVLKVILNPGASVAVARNHDRMKPSSFRDAMDEGIRMSSQRLRAHMPALLNDGWHILDTSEDTEHMTLARLMALLGDH